MRKPKSSRYRGVSFHITHQKWFAWIYDKSNPFIKRQLFLGLFHDESDAARAYNDKAVELYGDRAILNELPADPDPPSPEEIASACAAIREGWSESDYRRRAPHWAARAAGIDFVIERQLIAG